MQLLIHSWPQVAFWWLFVFLGSGPGLLLLCCFLRGETQIWLGDLRVVLCVLFLGSFFLAT